MVTNEPRSRTDRPVPACSTRSSIGYAGKYATGDCTSGPAQWYPFVAMMSYQRPSKRNQDPKIADPV
jgi:hypothetical protein